MTLRGGDHPEDEVMRALATYLEIVENGGDGEVFLRSQSRMETELRELAGLDSRLRVSIPEPMFAGQERVRLQFRAAMKKEDTAATALAWFRPRLFGILGALGLGMGLSAAFASGALPSDKLASFIASLPIVGSATSSAAPQEELVTPPGSNSFEPLPHLTVPPIERWPRPANDDTPSPSNGHSAGTAGERIERPTPDQGEDTHIQGPKPTAEGNGVDGVGPEGTPPGQGGDIPGNGIGPEGTPPGNGIGPEGTPPGQGGDIPGNGVGPEGTPPGKGGDNPGKGSDKDKDDEGTPGNSDGTPGGGNSNNGNNGNQEDNGTPGNSDGTPGGGNSNNGNNGNGGNGNNGNGNGNNGNNGSNGNQEDNRTPGNSGGNGNGGGNGNNK